MTFDRHDPDLADLDRLLGELADAESRVDAPPGIEGAVMAAWDERPRRRSRVAARLVRLAAPVAAAVLFAAGLSRLGEELRVAAPTLERQGALLLVGEPILPYERVRVVRMRVPTSTLEALGVGPADRTAATIDLDVVVGEDGVARAIRLVM